jgi:hypothetical protein
MRGRLRSLEQTANAFLISIPRLSGPPVKFPGSAAREAFLSSVLRLRGEEVSEHPLSTAVTNSSDRLGASAKASAGGGCGARVGRLEALH